MSLFILFQDILSLPHDKAIHILVGICIYAAFCYWLGPWAIVPVLLAAIFKECYDHYVLHILEDYKDLIATVIGGLIGMVITFLS